MPPVIDPPKRKPLVPARAAELLGGFVNAAPPAQQAEMRQRMELHIAAVTNHRLTLEQLPVTALLNEEAKSAVYTSLLIAITSGKTPQWHTLQGQENYGKRVDPLAVNPAPAPVVAPVVAPTPAPAPVVNVVAPAPEPSVAVDKSKLSGIARVIFDELEPFLPKQEAAKASVDKAEVAEMVENAIGALDLTEKVKAIAEVEAKAAAEAAVKAAGVTRIEIVNNGVVKPIEGAVHRQFATILKMAQCRDTSGIPVPIWLDGPPGAGKSHIMELVAEALTLEAHVLAIGPTDTKSAIVGSVATGHYKPGVAYVPYKDGGVLGIDEICAGDPGILNSVNTLSANRVYRFPNLEKVEKSKDLHIIVADNTRGTGSKGGFIRNKLDAATLDRFAFFTVEYDHALEVTLSGGNDPKWGGVIKQWCEYVLKVRDYVANHASQTIYITPRASIKGAAMLRGGFNADEAAGATLFALMPPDLRQTVIASVGKPRSE